METSNISFIVEAEDLSIQELQNIVNEHYPNLDIKLSSTAQKVGRDDSSLLMVTIGNLILNIASNFIYDFIKNLKASRSGYFGKTPYPVIETKNLVRVEFRGEIDGKALDKWVKFCLKNGGIGKISIYNESDNN